MHRFALVSLLVVVFYPTFSQSPLVQYTEVSFTSPFEKTILDDHFLNKKTDLFMLFMANGALLKETSITEHRDRFYTYLDAQQAKLAGKKNDKKVKLVYDDIHKTYFQKFEMQKNFEDIFYNGSYNAYSATALYGLAFDRLSIPYSIKEEAASTYLIAYPETDRVQLKSATPLGGFTTFDLTFKQNYVKMLKDQKVISAQEFASKDINTLFDRYYFGDQMNISLINLIGVQYLNDALLKQEAGNYAEAFSQLEKSYLFYPTDRCAYLLTLTGAQAVEARKEKDSVHASYISKLSRYKNYGITKEVIMAEFASIVQELLYTANKRTQLDQYYRQLDSGIQDPQIKSEITYIYQYEIGRILHNQARYKESIPYFESALRAKPNDLETSNALISATGQSFGRSGSNLDAIKTLEKYSLEFPSLMENNIFNTMLAYSYLAQFGMEYSINNPADGEIYRKQFEAYYEKYTDITPDNNRIAQSYSTAAVYYYRKGQTTKAKALISQGLKYAPDSYELKMRQAAIK